MIKLKIYFEDLREETKEEIIQMLREEQETEDAVEEEVKNGMDRKTAENEIIDNYINVNNRGVEYEI